MVCQSCGTENRAGRRFCSSCGAPLSAACPSCGADNEPEDRFCGRCGGPLDPAATPSAAPADPASPAPAATASAERKVVTVLFADLVGFTSISEQRDAEEVRELLSRYFDTSRLLITRYGGVVEKFIGDAVMAVWGTPTAREDDSERAVRAALEMTTAVAGLADEVGAPDLQARVGVLSGEAAVTIGAEGQGMVAGDLVNTASRIQSVAAPGTVLVGDGTRRASEAAVAYEDAGTHELKGKEQPVQLWRAIRVVGGVGGRLRATGLEAPFVGRSRELRLMKELYYSAAEERKAHLVSVVGVAGVGKSRLSWEFEKWMDGLVEEPWWHRGRCLAYGEGVAYWALAEMVRGRAGIVEGEPPAESRQKLQAKVAEMVAEDDERGWIEPRLAHLIGLEERATAERADLFAAWRMFFERMADTGPVEMVFEDLQWADDALLDFIEYVLEWSKDHPIFIVTVARPELADKRPGWGAGRRNFTSLFLEPMTAEGMDELIGGLVPGLSEDLRRRIRERAEGIPLYAVETVRMLLDRGLLEKVGEEYRPTGEVEDLEVPETLHALIAARLDGLAPEERRLLQDASVLGKTFTKRGVAAVLDVDEHALEPTLRSLVRKDVLSVQADPRSPERGQYGFLQDLVRKIAHDTLSRKDRRARHLAVARYLESGGEHEEEEVAEVVASHLLEAYRAAPDAEDAEEIRRRAVDALAAAGERAAGLAAHAEASRYFDQAVELESEGARKAGLLERSGMSTRARGDNDLAIERMEEAVALFERNGAPNAAARVSARLGEALWDRGRTKEAIDQMDRAFRVLSLEEPDEATAELAAQLGRFLYFSGESEAARDRIETALDIAESLWLPEVLSQALNTKGVVLYGAMERRREGFALLRYALEVALEHDVSSAALRAYYNLADLATQSDRYRDGRDYVDAGLAMARRIGDRTWEWQMLGQAYPMFVLGDWDRVVEDMGALPVERAMEVRGGFLHFLLALPRLHVFRGELEKARRAFEVFAGVEDSDDVQERSAFYVGKATLLRAEGRLEESLEHAIRALSIRAELGLGSENVREAFLEAVDAAFDLGDVEQVRALLRIVEDEPRGKRPAGLEAHATRFRARLMASQDGADPGEGFKLAVGMFRELEAPFWMAQTLLEHAEWLALRGRADEVAPLADEAAGVFGRLGARPWLERASKLAEVSSPAT